jgi:hypothetical protein
VSDARFQVAWTPRDVPLLARAVAACGPAARALGRRLAALDDDALRGLAAVAGDDLLVVLGEELPWIDGVLYLGRAESAPDLLLPTALAPTVPPALLEVAIRRLVTRTAPVAVLPDPARLVACGTARAIDRALLERWLEAA